MIVEEIESGKRSVIKKENGKFILDQEVKESIINEFKREKTITQSGDFSWNDKVDWVSAINDDRQAHYRMCPGAWIRRGAYIGERVIFMPCFVNIGAHIGSGTMIDSGVTIGSCAYIGENCHISSNTIVAGVLEPIQDNPCIIDDNCFVGSQCLLAEGVTVEEGCVIASGTRITQSTRIYNRQTGEYSFGLVPKNSIVIPGTYTAEQGLSIACAIITREVTAETRQQTSLRELLRS